MTSVVDTNPDDVKQANEEQYRLGERWPSDLPPAPAGRYWDRKINPLWPASDFKYIYFTSQFNNVDDPTKTDVEDVSKQWDLFRMLGYKWLGPGTDIDYNLKYNVQPVNALDAIAKEHDLDYRAIDLLWRRGEISYGSLLAMTKKADDKFVASAMDDPFVLSRLGAAGVMKLKTLVDNYFGPSFVTDLSKKGSLAGSSDFNRDDYLDRSGTDPWVSGGPGTPGWGMPPDSVGTIERPIDRISVVIDRNNNGIPDVLERKHHRRKKFYRHRPYLRYGAA